MRPPQESFAVAGPVRLCYETFGDRDAPPLLLVMGLGTQMIGWHTDFCERLAQRGFLVIRFDNRDVGRSTRLDHVPPPSLGQLLMRRPRPVAYTLDDMAGDAAGLLDALGLDSAHVAGASMGGMIAQQLAVRHPGRVRSLVSIMSTTGSPLRGRPRPRALPALLRRPPSERDAFVEHLVAVFETIGSPGFPRDPDELRELARLSFDRGLSAAGTARQLGGVIASGDRTAELRTVRAPTLVIHGRADPLISPSGGRATARAIPGARLILIEGMGHDLPGPVWPRIVAGIVDTARRAGEVGVGARRGAPA